MINKKQTTTERIENIESLILYTVLSMLLFQTLIWFIKNIPEEKIGIAMWGSAALITAFIFGVTLGKVYTNFFFTINEQINNITNKLTPNLLKIIATTVSVVLTAMIIIVFYEDSLAFLEKILSIIAAVVGLNYYLWKKK